MKSGYPSRVGKWAGLIVAAAYFYHLYAAAAAPGGVLICSLFVSHPHAKVGTLSSEVCAQYSLSLSEPHK